MNTRKILVGGTSIALLALSLSGCAGSAESAVAKGCQPESTFKTISAGFLTVAAPEFAPFSSNKDGKLTGVDADIIKEFAAKNCLDIKVESTSYAGTIPAVQSGRADVAIGCYYRTAVRAEIVSLSDPIYTDEMGIISESGVKDIKDLESMKVGTVDGYLWVPDMKKVMGANLTIYPSAVEMQADLKSGRIQAGIDGFGSAVQMYKSDAKYKVAGASADPRVVASKEPAQIGFPIGKDNVDMTKAMDSSIAAMKSSGKIAEVVKSYGLPQSAVETGEPRLVK
jgi:polar amino acid transport system substrate-binding protein